MLIRTRSLLLALLAALSGLALAQSKDQTAPRTDEEILKSVKLPEGYSATVFAKPPELGYPTSVSAAIDGTIFVAVDENGSLDRKQGRGRVVRMRDTDGDGKADEFKVFAEMDSPRGVIWDGPSGTAPGTLYVMHPPNLTAYTDTDGDGKADKQEEIVTGLGFDLNFRGADHTTNGCRLGIDGFIYVACGDYGFTKAVARDGTTLSMRGGGIVRVRPDGTGFEIVSRGQRNIYDVAISPTMDLFTRDNTNDGGGWDVRLSFVPPGAHMGYPYYFKNFSEDMLQPLADYGGGSPCGALWIDEPGLQNGLYTVEWGRNAIMYHRLKQKGAGWEVDGANQGQTEWIKMTRPTDMDVDASGRIYITSWEGATFNYNGPNAGFVLRVVKKDLPKVEVPDLAATRNEEFTSVLFLGKSATLRLAAQREAIRRMLAGTMQAVRPIQNSRGTREMGLNTLAAHAINFEGARLYPAPLDNVLAEGRGTPLEATYLKMIVWTPAVSTPTLIQYVEESLRNQDPVIRASAVTALRRLDHSASAQFILPLVADSDPIVSHLAVRALSELKASQVCLAALDSADDKVKPGALRALYGIYEPAVVEGLIARLSKEKGSAGSQPATAGILPAQSTNIPGKMPAIAGKMPALPSPSAGREPVFNADDSFNLRRGILNTLCRLANQEAPYTDPKVWWGTRPDTTGPIYQPIAWSETEKITAALKAALDNSSEDDARWLVQRMYQTKVNYPGLVELMLAKAGTDTAARLTAVQGMFRADNILPNEALGALEAIARDEKETPDFRARALRLLSRTSERGAALDAVVSSYAAFAGRDLGQSPVSAAFEEFTRDAKNTKHIGALERFASGSNAAKRTLAQTILVNLATSALVKGKEKESAQGAVEKCWVQPESAASLLGVIARTKAKTYAEKVTAHLKDPNNAVAEAALYAYQTLGLNDSAPSAKRIGEMNPDMVAAIVLKGSGDAAAGKEMYLRAGCIACHTIDANEPPKGPVLSAVAKVYDRAALTESILKPNAKIAQGFESAWFRTKKGEQVEGFVTREAGDSVDVRNIVGQSVTIEKAEIAERGHRPQSMMPEGLMAAFTPSELANLLAYLESLKAK
jgi:putative heme-binding domain-containing protein